MKCHPFENMLLKSAPSKSASLKRMPLESMKS